ncbi:hypothetical protein [Nocardia abscessus]|uniref:hypothetical protein n=1 Tax=Nocardia abscessus TaxID=120957 RepID=UPI0024559A88|nr:hypothetical protein [Nocardia abscessus]
MKAPAKASPPKQGRGERTATQADPALGRGAQIVRQNPKRRVAAEGTQGSEVASVEREDGVGVEFIGQGDTHRAHQVQIQIAILLPDIDRSMQLRPG